MQKVKMLSIPGVFKHSFNSTISKIPLLQNTFKRPYSAKKYDKFLIGSRVSELWNTFLYEKEETMASTPFFKAQ